MAKTMPAEATGADRADWEKDDYTVAFLKAELKENPFYKSADHLQKEYGDPEPGERYWLATNAKGETVKRYADFIEDFYQWNMVFEVLDGDKKGDWLFVYCSPRFYAKKDGTWGGKLAAIYLAAMPDFDLSLGIEEDLSDLLGKPLRAVVEPKENKQYAKVTGWLPVKAADRKKHEEAVAAAKATADELGGEEVDDNDGSEIPF